MSFQLETVASYISPSIIRHFLAGVSTRSEASREQFHAAILAADISGFTRLSETLAQQGPAGAEALSSLLNDYFGRLIDLITLHGGEVAKFAGDALLALWPAASEADLADLALRATQCGLAVQESLAQFAARAENPLSLRITIGAGQLSTLYLGGVFDRWVDLIAGVPIINVHKAQDHAHAGQVVLAPIARGLIADRLSWQPLPDEHALVTGLRAPLPVQPAQLPAADADMVTALVGHIPAAIRERLVAGQSGWLAELRRVSLLFINLPHIGDHTRLTEAQEVLCTLQETIYHYEGSVNKLSVDEKGVTLVAALGLPPLAHVDDPQRAIQAALAIHERLRAEARNHAIGITTGRAFCGSIGNDTRREYTMIGNVVNMAARLMQAAAERHYLLCDESTYAATRGRFRFDVLPPITVKGRSEAVAVFRPVASAAHRLTDTSTLVGRDAELAAAAAALQRLQDRQSGVLIVEGEAGIGKSRLVDEVIHQAGHLGLATQLGSGDALRQSTPYHAWQPVLAQFFELDLFKESPSQQRQRVLAHLAGRFADLLPLAPLLNAILPLDLPESELTAQMNGQVRSHNIQLVLLRLLAGAAGAAPRLIILEDSHWLDSASWELARLVRQEIHPLLLVIVTRPMPEPAPAIYQRLRTDDQAHLLHLDTMPPAAIRDLVCIRLGVDALPEPVLELIERKAEGHPFFSEELAYALRDAGLIQIHDRQCLLVATPQELYSLDFPDTIQGVITSRIDRLAPQQSLTLKVASVIGRVFAYRLLRDIHPIPDDRPHLVNYLNHLESLDITPLETPEPDLSYVFKHIITQEVAYNLMSFSQRERLHQAAAEWYETTFADDLSPYYPLLAHHWQKAHQVARSMVYYGWAGEQALNQFANQEALTFLKQALTLFDAAAQDGTLDPTIAPLIWQARRVRQLGEAYIGLGDLVNGKAQLEKTAGLLDRPVAASPLRLTLNLLRQLNRQLWHRFWPGRFIGRRRDQQDPQLLEAAHAYDRLGEVYYFANETVLTLYATIAGLNLAQQAAPSPVLARLLANMGVALSLVPWHAQAQFYAAQALQAAENSGDLHAMAWVRLVSALYHTGNGHWQAGRHTLETALNISDRLNAQRVRDQIINSLALQAYLEGDYKQGYELFRQTATTTRRRGDIQLHVLTLAGKAQGLLVTGRLAEAEQILNEALSQITEAQSIEAIWIFGQLATIHVRQGTAAAAWEYAGQAARLIAGSQPTSYLNLEGYAGVALAALSQYERTGGPTWHSASKRACRDLRAFARVFQVGRPRAWHFQGWLYWLEGRHKQAERAWQRSLREAGRLAMPYETALTHWRLGQHLPPGESRREHQRLAAAISADLGVVIDLPLTQNPTS